MREMMRDHRALEHREESYEELRRRIFAGQRARNRKEAKKRLVLCVAGLVLACILSVQLFSVVGHAKGEGEQKFKYYTSVCLNYGDTLWSIADEYMDEEYYDHFTYIAEVKSINHIQNGDDVTAGKMIIVPYYSTEYRAQ